MLKFEKDNFKALLRRATAFYKKKKFQEAKKDIDRCLQLDALDKKAKVNF